MSHHQNRLHRTAMNSQTREQALTQMEHGEQLDVLVVGGGITGAGIALDAATRGLRTAVVDGQDWAGATSRWSSKLVHGGLRYLQQLDVKLVAEALGERERLLFNLAPHLVRAVPFLYPLSKKWERPYVGTGIGLYDTLAQWGSKVSSLPRREHLTVEEINNEFPDLRDDASVGAFKYWDARVDDARLVLTILRTAVGQGALAANRTEVVELLTEEDEFQDGRVVVGAVLEDKETGRRFPVRAKHVISATGVWTEHLQDLAGAEAGLQVLASKGVHIVVPRERINGEVGLILQTEKSVLFVIPWEHHWIIGTTDTPYQQSPETPVASGADIDYVLDHANQVLEDPLTRQDVIGVYAGLRPLLQPVAKDESAGSEAVSTKVSREHTVMEPVPGLISIAGGKLTTYRVMAEDAVDLALGDSASQRPSVTDRVLLHGADGWVGVAARMDAIHQEIQEVAGDQWTRQHTEDLLHRYGSAYDEVLAIMEEDPATAQPLPHAQQHVRAEIIHACRYESPLHLEDLMDTRTRLTYAAPRHGLDAAEEIAQIAAAELGWTREKMTDELAAYTARSEAEDRAAQTHDDAAAATARDAAGSVVNGLGGPDRTRAQA
ncbi:MULTISPECIES: glycerol-3-phosphate dehydrogenase/oxidase [Kocuria]|uniref:Glycerol-3-phosphate dehydrogenase n=1 Tax=Kocuria subflava TaxID=1736139 RepID=A0A846TJP7_9MICC|nr:MULTISPECIES: glycerol-3-phosphate dehydrogenase/oxidase [Kocuria]NKE08703.1 glycerol-3-phosphate dehydrogenase/oxidase [Kocuria subflava]